MEKRTRTNNGEFDDGPYDDFDDLFDDDFNIKSFSRNIHSTEWGDNGSERGRGSARRKIERRNEMKRLYSELNDWEEFGENENEIWYTP